MEVGKESRASIDGAHFRCGLAHALGTKPTVYVFFLFFFFFPQAGHGQDWLPVPLLTTHRPRRAYVFFLDLDTIYLLLLYKLHFELFKNYIIQTLLIVLLNN